MKTIFKFTVALLLLASYQGFSQKGFYIGAGGNVTTTWITEQNNYGLPELDYKIKMGYGGALNLGYDFDTTLGLKLEIGFVRMGQKYYGKMKWAGFDYQDVIRDINFNYIQIPILFKYSPQGKDARFYVMAGPQVGILTSAKQKFTNDGVTIPNKVTAIDGTVEDAALEDIKHRYQKVDVMARMDLGVDIFATPSLIINLGLTTAYGFIELNDKNWEIENLKKEIPKSHNFYAGLNIGICYKFFDKDDNSESR